MSTLKSSDFYKAFGLVNALLLAVLVYWHSLEGWASLWDLSIIGLVVFGVYQVVLYRLCIRSLQYSNHAVLTKLVLGSFLVKFIIVISCVSIYYLVIDPTHPQFVLPYLLIYVVHAIFGTWFLNRMKS